MKIIETHAGELLIVAIPKTSTNHEVKFVPQSERFVLSYDLPAPAGFSSSGGKGIMYKVFGGKPKYPKNLEFVCTSINPHKELFGFFGLGVLLEENDLTESNYAVLKIIRSN